MQQIFFPFTVNNCHNTCTIPVLRLRLDTGPASSETHPVRTPEAQQPHLYTALHSWDVRLSLPLPFCLFTPDMQEILTYLHDPELVARFQRRCGLYLVETVHHSRGRIRGRLKGRWDRQDNKSNYKYEENGCAVSVSPFLRFIKTRPTN